MPFGLYISAEGAMAQSLRMKTVANNLANVDTLAFKRGRPNFEDLFYRHIKLPGNLDAASNPTSTGISVGLGSRVQSVQTEFAQGAFSTTNNPLDVAIEGSGFFPVIDPSTNEILYTRAGNFSINATQQLVIGSANTGRILEPAVQFPPDYTGIIIGPDGQVQVQQAGQAQFTQVGQLQLASFINPEGLLKLGENLYKETPASGAANLATPGTNGLGKIQETTIQARILANSATRPQRATR